MESAGERLVRTITGALFLFLISTEVLQAIEVRLEISSPVAAIGEPVYVQVHINDAAGVDCVIEFLRHRPLPDGMQGFAESFGPIIILVSNGVRPGSGIFSCPSRREVCPRSGNLQDRGRVLTTQTVTLDVTATSANRPRSGTDAGAL